MMNLKENDEVHVEAFNDLPSSVMVVSEVLDGAITGYVTFEGDSYAEYGELYEEDFHHITEVVQKG